MAVINTDIERALMSAGVTTDAQIIASKIKSRKFRDHKDLDATRLRNVQDAYDYGEVLIDPPHSHGQQGDRYTLIAYYQDEPADGADEGVWWRHVTEAHPTALLLKTVFDDWDVRRRAEVYKRDGLIVVRKWDSERWQNRKEGRK